MEWKIDFFDDKIMSSSSSKKLLVMMPGGHDEIKAIHPCAYYVRY